MLAFAGAGVETTSAGHSYSLPDVFALSAAGPVLRFTAPEGDATVVRDDKAAKTTLILRDAHHEYRFVASK